MVGSTPMDTGRWCAFPRWAGWALVALFSAPGGCVSALDGFQCKSNDQCLAEDGRQGVCEATGFCSFADAACSDSGRRYGDDVPDPMRSQCVGVAAGGRCVTELAAGGDHSCALKTDGTVWCWGANDKAQLGGGSGSKRATPAKVEGLDGARVAHISAGIEHTCAVSDAGAVYCWGSNEDGQLGVVDGNGDKIGDSASAVAVTGLTGAVTSFSAGGKHTCAIVGGDLFCWGENASYQLGDGSTEERTTPVGVMGVHELEAVSNGDESTCAVDGSRALWCWGSNGYGQLGDPSVSSAPMPTQVASLTSVAELASGDEHVCISKPDTSIWCWGYNSTGEVGNGGGADQKTPVKVFSADHVVSSGNAFHSCAYTDVDGALWCWGSNDKGQIGSGSADKVVPAPSAVKLLGAAGVAVGGSHSCALTKDGSVWCWGDNESGQVGPAVTGTVSPVPVLVALCP